MDEGIWGQLRAALRGKRVLPTEPPGRASLVAEADIPEPVTSNDADDAATWTAHIRYQDAAGAVSERMITIRSISGSLGEPEIINAVCHVRNRLRAFRIDRIQEMACIVTGEIIDPRENCMILQRLGALKVEDKALTHLMKLLVFMAKCDGHFHGMERAVFEDVLGRYALRFGGNDETLAVALVEAERLAPDADDLMRSLRAFERMPQREKICRFALDSTAAIIDADGRHAPEEIQWALEVSSALKQLSVARH